MHCRSRLSRAAKILAITATCFCLSLLTVQAVSLPDADQDGLPDTWETMVFATNPLQADSDGDTYMDRSEILNGYQPMGAARLTETDYDRDGLSDRLELLFETDPTAADTNMNGKLDGPEIRLGMSASSTVPFVLQKSLFVSLKKQQLEMRVNNIAIAAHSVSGGLPRTPTPVGTFKILQKHPRAWSNSAKLWMPYWMHFSGRGHGFHELPEWPGGRKEGENHLGRPASHGCVRLGIGAAKAVYDWSPVGTPVVISKL